MATSIPGAVENCNDISHPCDTLCEDNCVDLTCRDICLQRVKLDGSVYKLCFAVGVMGLCRGRPNPMDWSMVVCKKGTNTDLLSYPGFEFDLNGNICFVLDSLILGLDQSKRYVAKIQKCGIECGRIELCFEPCFTELFSITRGNAIECVDYTPAPSCEQLSTVTECETTETGNVPCT